MDTVSPSNDWNRRLQHMVESLAKEEDGFDMSQLSLAVTPIHLRLQMLKVAVDKNLQAPSHMPDHPFN